MKEQLYTLYLNDSPYGQGDFSYMEELIADYVKVCDIYGRTSVSLVIEKLQRKPLVEGKGDTT